MRRMVAVDQSRCAGPGGMLQSGASGVLEKPTGGAITEVVVGAQLESNDGRVFARALAQAVLLLQTRELLSQIVEGGFAHGAGACSGAPFPSSASAASIRSTSRPSASRVRTSNWELRARSSSRSCTSAAKSSA